MNKEEIFEKLDNSMLDKNHLIVISGASLVVQDVIDSTRDIDLSCDREYYESLDENVRIGAFGIEVKTFDGFDISYNLYFPNDVIVINGYKFMTLEKCLEIKEQLNRDKDREVIRKLKRIIN